jgi:hypothetical protein
MKDWKFLTLVLILMFVAFYVFFGALVGYGVVVFMVYQYTICYYSHDFEFCYEDSARTYTVKVDHNKIRQYRQIQIDKVTKIRKW